MLHVVEDALAGERLVPVDHLHEVRVESPEVRQLASRVDLRLMRCLARVEHGRGVQRLPVLARQ